MTSSILGYDPHLPTDKRGELLEAFFQRYRYRLDLENQPTEAFLAKVHSRRTAEVIPLSKVTGAVDGRVSNIEPVRLRKSFSILIDPKRCAIFAKTRRLSQIPRKFRTLSAGTNVNVCASIRTRLTGIDLEIARRGPVARVDRVAFPENK